VRWEVFSKHFEHEVNTENISIFPVNNDALARSMASSHGVICGAGFETPAEALFLGKKLLVIPMKNQYEQHCNAEALKKMGVPVVNSLKEKHLQIITRWLESDVKIEVNYPDNTEEILEHVLRIHAVEANNDFTGNTENSFGVKSFRRLTLKRIISKLGT
jgi:UDP-N-acetylglucosamine:LPS N-acetylglucosamine transferase